MQLAILEDNFALNLDHVVSIFQVYSGKEPCGIVFTLIDGSRKEIKTTRSVAEVVKRLDPAAKI